jgi:FkbM family methyltransferase
MEKIKLITGNYLSIIPRLSQIYSDFEPLSTKEIYEKTKENDVFIDVGANMGFFSAIASELVGKMGNVFSIEANPSILEILKSNTPNLNATIINSAVGNRCGTTEFYVTDDTVNSGIAQSPFVKNNQKITIPILTLDKLMEDKTFPDNRANFIKIDVQGDEVAVLEGAKKLINCNDRLCILVEWAPGWMEMAGYKLNDLPDLITSLGFRKIYVIDEYLKKKLTLQEMKKEFSSDKSGKRFCNIFAIK